MNKVLSRALYNVFIKKNGSKYSIVRHANGFSHKGKIIAAGFSNEAEALLGLRKVLYRISRDIKQHGVFIELNDKAAAQDVATMIVSFGLANSDVRVQNDGIVYFLQKGDTEEEVKNTISEALSEAGVNFKDITIVRADAIPSSESETGKKLEEEAKAAETKTAAITGDMLPETEEAVPATAYKEINPNKTDVNIGAKIEPTVAYAPVKQNVIEVPETENEAMMTELLLKMRTDPEKKQIDTSAAARYRQLKKQADLGLLKEDGTNYQEYLQLKADIEDTTQNAAPLSQDEYSLHNLLKIKLEDGTITDEERKVLDNLHNKHFVLPSRETTEEKTYTTPEVTSPDVAPKTPLTTDVNQAIDELKQGGQVFKDDITLFMYLVKDKGLQPAAVSSFIANHSSEVQQLIAK